MQLRRAQVLRAIADLLQAAHRAHTVLPHRAYVQLRSTPLLYAKMHERGSLCKRMTIERILRTYAKIRSSPAMHAKAVRLDANVSPEVPLYHEAMHPRAAPPCTAPPGGLFLLVRSVYEPYRTTYLHSFRHKSPKYQAAHLRAGPPCTSPPDKCEAGARGPYHISAIQLCAGLAAQQEAK